MAERAAVYRTLNPPFKGAIGYNGDVSLKSPPFPISSDWLGWINHRLIDLIRRKGVCRFGFVTFNYDRLIEASMQFAIRTMLGASSDLEEDRLPTVHHVYGRLAGDLQKLAEEADRSPSAGEVQQMASGIRLMGERSEGVAGPELEAARQVVKSAKSLVFLGFGFDRTNMEILGIRNDGEAWRSKDRPAVVGTAFGKTVEEVAEARVQFGQDRGIETPESLYLEGCTCLELIRRVRPASFFIPE
jgi:hypothetical protein